MAVISNGDIELPGALLIYYAGEAAANVQGESLKAVAVIRKNDFLTPRRPPYLLCRGGCGECSGRMPKGRGGSYTMVIFELPGALLIYYVGEAAANVQGGSLKAAAVIRKNDFLTPRRLAYLLCRGGCGECSGREPKGRGSQLTEMTFALPGAEKINMIKFFACL